MQNHKLMQLWPNSWKNGLILVQVLHIISTENDDYTDCVILLYAHSNKTCQFILSFSCLIPTYMVGFCSIFRLVMFYPEIYSGMNVYLLQQGSFLGSIGLNTNGRFKRARPTLIHVPMVYFCVSLYSCNASTYTQQCTDSARSSNCQTSLAFHGPGEKKRSTH